MFLALLAGVTSLTWAAVLLRKTQLVGACLAVLLAGCCFGHPFFQVDLGPIPLTLDRILLVGLIVLVAAYRWWGVLEIRPLNLTDLLMLTWIGFLGASTLAHDWQLDGAKPLARLIAFYGMPVTLYWVARQCRWQQRQVLGVFGFLALLGSYFAVTALAEQQQFTALVFPRYIASPTFVEFYGRARGSLLNPVGLGIFLIVGLVSTLFWWGRLQTGGRLMIALASAAGVAGIACTLTRSVWLSAAIAVILLLAACVPRDYRLPSLIAAACAFIMALAAGWNDFSAFKRDEFVSVEDMAKSAELRPILATVAWNMFQDQPLTGCGFGQYTESHIYYLGDRSSTLPLEVARPYVQHNVVLGMLTETGILGAGLFLLVILAWAKEAWTLWSDARRELWARQAGLLLLVALAVYLINGMFHDVAIISMVHMLLFFLAAMVRGLAADVGSLPQGCPAATQ